jgi:hypothetical protein
VASVDSQIDELYQLPLSEFTAARNALAKTLVGAEAQRVRHLAKPTVVPWAINQLYWNDRASYERLLKSGQALRAAQIATLAGKGDRAEVQRASDAHRKALAEAVHRATKAASDGGLSPDPDALSRMLEAVSLLPKLPSAAGRLAEMLRPAGFEALTGVQPGPHAVAALRLSGRKTDRSVPGPEGQKKLDRRMAAQELRERRAAQEQKRKAQADVKRAQSRLEKLRTAKERIRRELDQAEEAVRDAERQLVAAKVRANRLL